MNYLASKFNAVFGSESRDLSGYKYVTLKELPAAEEMIANTFYTTNSKFGIQAHLIVDSDKCIVDLPLHLTPFFESLRSDDKSMKIIHSDGLRFRRKTYFKNGKEYYTITIL